MFNIGNLLRGREPSPPIAGLSTGAIPYWDGTSGTWKMLAISGTATVLTEASGLPTWAAAGGGGIGSKAQMTSSQAFTSTTLANVTSLSLSVSSSTIYRLLVLLSVVGSASTTGIKFGWTYPSGTTMLWNGVYDSNTGGGLEAFNSDPSFGSTATGLAESATMNAANDTTTRPIVISGIVHTGGSSGTLQFQAARYAGSGTATINKGVLILL